MKGMDAEVYDGKSLSGLLKDIIDISNEKRDDIKGFIKEMSRYVTSATDVVNIGPIIQQYLEVSVKNDDQLAKVATVVQRLVTAEQNSSTEDTSELLSDKEKDQLLKSALEDISQSGQEISKELDSLPKKKPNE